jgi:hypothetical protein
MAFDITLKTPGTRLPELKPGQFRYVLGRDGLHLERCTGMYTSSVKVDGPIPFLEPHPQQCQLHCGPIPVEMLRQMVGFFQAAYEMHHGEAALVLLYYPETGQFAWHCPKQTIEMYSCWGRYYPEDSVQYDNPLTLPEGAVHFGDAHSHIGPPSPSIVDHNDETHLDGLHIIVGYINSRIPKWHIDFCIDGHRFSVPPSVMLEAVPEAPFPDPPEEWMKEIHVVYPKSYYKSSSNSDWQGSTYSTSSYNSGSSRSSSYDSSGNGRRYSRDEEEGTDNKSQPPKRLEGPTTDGPKTTGEDRDS